MTTFRQLGTPARLLLLFIFLAAVPLAALGWLGWRLLDQDRALERQRVRERLAEDAGLLAAESERALGLWEIRLAGAIQLRVPVPPGGVFLVCSSKGVLHQQGVHLPYYPAVDSGGKSGSNSFNAAEIQEFQTGDLARAAAMYRKFAASSDQSQRANALMRLARSLRKQDDIQGALRAYMELSAMGDTIVAGTPAELLARGERVTLFRTGHDTDATERESHLLTDALEQGRYIIDHATFDLYSRIAGGALKTDVSAVETARAIENLWPLFVQQPAGRSMVKRSRHGLVAVWQPSAEGTVVMVGGAETLLAPVFHLAQKLEVRIAFEDARGQLLAGDPRGRQEHATKTYRETGLPWSMHVWPADIAQSQDQWKARRGLFGAGFGLMGVVIAAATYLAFRAVHRELAVARLQSDFVSAVSHEFRTPLTAIRHLTEMLEENGAPQDRLPQYYRALAREARRLHGIVESLLDFGSMEAGRRTYHMEETNPAILVRRVVDEFRERPGGGGERLAFDAPQNAFTVRADREAIALALRNLVDNALKYSPESSPVAISILRRGELAGISVEDHGPGISRREQRAVFRKFVRGASARAGNVKGTGIGLTLAAHIIKAHGGSLELASEAGHGSRFTILLPGERVEQ